MKVNLDRNDVLNLLRGIGIEKTGLETKYGNLTYYDTLVEERLFNPEIIDKIYIDELMYFYQKRKRKMV
jgi:hypothetical protein